MNLRPPPPRPPHARTARPAPRRPVHRGIWIGVALICLGFIAAFGWFVVKAPSIGDDIDRLDRASPGLPAEFTIAETVDWDVFLEPSAASQARFRFAILDGDGEPVRLGNDHGSTYEWFSRSGRSIASVVLEPGDYRMEVTEGTATVALGPSPTGRIFRVVGGAIGLGSVLGISGIVILIVSAVRDTRRRTESAERPPPSPWSSGEWPAEPGR